MTLPKLVVLSLFSIAIMGLGGVLVLGFYEKKIPVGVEGLLGTAVGAIGSILARTDHAPTATQDVQVVNDSASPVPTTTEEK